MQLLTYWLPTYRLQVPFFLFSKESHLSTFPLSHEAYSYWRIHFFTGLFVVFLNLCACIYECYSLLPQLLMQSSKIPESLIISV
jgi:hypothetical protein